MTERRFTELQCRLTIAPFLRLLKKKNTHISKEDFSHILLFVPLATYLSLRNDHDVLNFFFHNVVRQVRIFTAEV